MRRSALSLPTRCRSPVSGEEDLDPGVGVSVEFGCAELGVTFSTGVINQIYVPAK
ncbi:hypothetical protein GPX89_12560 [Nocardia sp. ET3-3]|uniref:Uncharacterized protein n=1 Tax=Nocardia terrae TaxID=2675851 RepID=A0A7K1UUW2_9NOCA|nr:hypothetical protein [Nocardia terrae]MVU78072.1 hypothetical protein [Nocardia terrae]